MIQNTLIIFHQNFIDNMCSKMVTYQQNDRKKKQIAFKNIQNIKM